MKITTLPAPIVANTVRRSVEALPPIDYRIQLIVGAVFLAIIILFTFSYRSKSSNSKNVSNKTPKNPKKGERRTKSSSSSLSSSSSYLSSQRGTPQPSPKPSHSEHSTSSSLLRKFTPPIQGVSKPLRSDYKWDEYLPILHEYFTLSSTSSPLLAIDFQEFDQCAPTPLKKSPKEIQSTLESILKKLSLKDPRNLTIHHLYEVLKQQKHEDIRGSILEMVSLYHPYTISPQEFKDYCSTQVNGKTSLNREGLAFSLYLLGFYTYAHQSPNIKGCRNLLSIYERIDVDLIPTSKFVILLEDNTGLRKDFLKNFQLDQYEGYDEELRNGMITFDEHRKLYIDAQNSDYLFNV